MPTTSGSTSAARGPTGTQSGRVALVIGALGVVFGDVGTSPIYTVQTIFNPGDPHPVPITTDNVYGVVSLIFWSVMIIVTRGITWSRSAARRSKCRRSIR
jgi:KUP system potassium uptake protein